MRRQHNLWTRALKLSLISAVVGWGCLSLPSVARAGLEPLTPQLSVTGGTGIPGGTVSVTLALAGDANDSGVSAGVDLRFDDRLEFSDFAENCKLADRLTSTHQLAGRLVSPGLLNLEIAIQVGPPPPPPLGDGDLATCDFAIKTGVDTGTAALEIESPFLGNAEGGDIPVDIEDGFVTIVSVLPTGTPTVTPTPADTSTATVTSTPVVTASVTATATATPSESTGTVTATATVTSTSSTSTPQGTATATKTPAVPTATSTPASTSTATRTGGTGATPTSTKKPDNNDDGCNVMPPQQSDATGTAALLLIPGLLMWVRRRG